MQVNITKIHPDAKEPTYGSEGATCFDLYSTGEGDVGTIKASAIFGTGLKFEIPEGYGMFIFSRSGHGFKNSVRLANCVGVIDSDYRGEVMVKLTADSITQFQIMKGDRIAQAVILPVEKTTFNITEQLSITARDAGGFGSTGSN